MAWGVNNSGWWGEGEVKFFIDGDAEFPTICGTGTEDYFCGSYNFDVGKENGGYREFTTPYAGWRKSFGPMGSTSRSRGSECIAGTSWIRLGLSATCG